MHPRSVSSVTVKAVNTYVHVVFLVFNSNKFGIKANVLKFSSRLCHYGVLYWKNEFNPFKNKAGITPSHIVKCNIRFAPYFRHLNMVMGKICSWFCFVFLNKYKHLPAFYGFYCILRQSHRAVLPLAYGL